MKQLDFDFEAPQVGHVITPAPAAQRHHRGRRAHLSGHAAEDIALRGYASRGAHVLARRWRGTGGEVDLVLRESDNFVFCEVKRAANFDLALTRIRPEQVQRIFGAASEYLGQTPQGQLSPVRFDLALVDGTGDLRIIENAFRDF
ncbi:YraN family protein [Roseovarius tibetensis]|uniref:YraN family protein n=1 Tax=Roseovarius tibetensis TaxID=2685897 RepID=UPI003D7F7EF0